MRVLLAVHGFPPIQNSGAERAAERIATWLTGHGNAVEVFTIGRLNDAATRLETVSQDGMLVHRLSFNIKAGEDPFRNTYDNPLVGEALRAILATGRFDLVHLVSGYLFAGQVIHTAHEHGLPVVLTLTEYYYLCPRLNLMHADSRLCTGPESDEKCARCLLEEKRRFRPIRQYAPALMDAYWSLAGNSSLLRDQIAEVQARRETLRSALDAVDLVIAPSRFIIEKHAEQGIDTSRYVFIQHGLDRPDEAIPRPTAFPRGRLRIGYTGQIKVHKGVDLLVEAAIGLLDAGREVEVQLWGNPDDQTGYASSLIEQTRSYPAIRWCGAFEGARAWEVLAGMDVLVVPSRWYENCPTVILEAFKMGIPVVATGIGGMAEMVQPGINGLSFRLNDAADLRDQLERLAGDPALLAQLRAGIPRVKTASEEVAEIFEQYQRVLPPARGSSTPGS